jgi:hypothetical protein
LNNKLFVTSRNGTEEAIDLDRIHKVIAWACEGLYEVPVTKVKLKQHIQNYGGLNNFISTPSMMSFLDGFIEIKKLSSRWLVVIKAIKNYLFNIGRKTEFVEISITFQKLLQSRLQCRSPPHFENLLCSHNFLLFK